MKYDSILHVFFVGNSELRFSRFEYLWLVRLSRLLNSLIRILHAERVNSFSRSFVSAFRPVTYCNRNCARWAFCGRFERIAIVISRHYAQFTRNKLNTFCALQRPILCDFDKVQSIRVAEHSLSRLFIATHKKMSSNWWNVTSENYASWLIFHNNNHDSSGTS